jgi:predicted Zn finger-like uncharacterized protein
VKISCPTCSAKYSVADEKIQSRLAKIRCRKCSSTIVIDGTASPAKVYVGDAGSPSAPPQDMEAGPSSGRAGLSAAPGGSDPVGPAQDEYAVDIADNDQRNMTIHQIVGAYNEGLITADTYIWKEGMADWQTLGEVREVASALHAAARPAAAAQPAAVRRGNHNSSADLFGRIHTAGGEDDITTSAPEPAQAMTAGTGARNESSVLFSLSALTGSTTAAASPAMGSSGGSSAKRRGSDDSGLIDLQALTSAEAGGAGGFAAAPSAFGASPLISAPLGGVSGPALGGGASYGGRSGSRWGLIAAAVLLAVAMIGGAVMFLPRSGGETDQPTSALDRTAASAEHAAAPKEPAAKEPEANIGSEPAQPGSAAGTTRPVVAEELPTAPSEPSTAKPTSAAKPAVPRLPRPAVAKPTTGLPPAPMPVPEAPKPVAAAPKPAAAAAPAADPKKRCECKASDLLCAMKCSAKKP